MFQKSVLAHITGKRKKVERSDKEKMPFDRKELSIIDQDIWDQAQKRWKELNGSWPMTKISDKTSQESKSYVHSNPAHLLAGLLKRKCCSGAMGSGKWYE